MLRRMALLGLLLPTAYVYAQNSANIDLQRSADTSIYTITVPAPVSLRIILETICAASGSYCEGTALADSRTIAPCIIRGTWHDVLRQLFQGSGLNYVASSGSSESPGTLIVAARSMPAASDVHVATSSAGRPISPDATSSDGLSQQATFPSEPSDEPSSEIAATATSEVAPQQSAGNTNSAARSYLPFPDAGGRPIPATTPGVAGGFAFGPPPPTRSTSSQTFLPFPDSDGEPIPTQPAGPGYPFGPTPVPKR